PSGSVAAPEMRVLPSEVSSTLAPPSGRPSEASVTVPVTEAVCAIVSAVKSPPHRQSPSTRPINRVATVDIMRAASLVSREGTKALPEPVRAPEEAAKMGQREGTLSFVKFKHQGLGVEHGGTGDC